MALYITEYPNAPGLAHKGAILPYEAGLGGAGSSVVTTTVISSGGTVSTFFLQPNTSLVRLQATSNAWFLGSLSTTSTSVVTSTNAGLIAPNVAPEYRLVKGGARVTALST